MSVSDLKSDKIINEAFSSLTTSDAAWFEPFRLSSDFGDTSFSMLYAWAERFDYRCRFYDDLIAVTGKGVNGKRGFFILRSSKKVSIEKAFDEILGLCCLTDTEPVFEYISEKELSGYIHAARKIGRSTEITFMDKYSDYIYKVSDYTEIGGRKNKSKRGGYNFLIRNYPGLNYVRYDQKLYRDCTEIFNKWCSAHNCEKCCYGCEFRAFERFAENYDPSRQMIGLSYNGSAPLSFAVCEKINRNTVCCYFQKNAEKIRGLTYWLSRQILSEYEDTEYLNLGEDMGIEGIITDKTLLRPYAKIKKYTVKIL